MTFDKFAPASIMHIRFRSGGGLVISKRNVQPLTPQNESTALHLLERPAGPQAGRSSVQASIKRPEPRQTPRRTKPRVTHSHRELIAPISEGFAKPGSVKGGGRAAPSRKRSAQRGKAERRRAGGLRPPLTRKTRCRSRARTRAGAGGAEPDPPLRCACTKSTLRSRPG